MGIYIIGQGWMGERGASSGDRTGGVVGVVDVVLASKVFRSFRIFSRAEFEKIFSSVLKMGLEKLALRNRH